MTLLIAAISLFAKFSADPELMFPEGSESAAAYSTVRDAGLYSAVTVELDTKSTNSVLDSVERVRRFVDEVAGMPGVMGVDSGVSRDAASAFARLPEIFVQLFPPSRLDDIDPGEAASAALAAMISGAPASVLRNDPGRFRQPFVDSLQAWRRNSPFRFSLHGGMMYDESGRYALVRVDTDPLLAGDSRRAKELLDGISRPREGLEACIVSPLVHAVENERLARGDVFRVGVVSSVALALVFLFLYRGDLRALWIPVMPLVAALFAFVCCCVIFERISLLVLGVGGGIAGFAVDQGIHVYAAVRGSGSYSARRLTRALATALATSVVAFVSVVASGVPVFIQLGVFASLMLTFNFFLSRYALPRLLGAGRRESILPGAFAAAKADRPLIAGAVVLSVLALVFLPRTETDFALSSLDGTPGSIRDGETAFTKRWANPSGGCTAVVVREDEDALLAALEGCGRWTPAALVPPAEARRRNVELWKSPGTADRLAALKEELAAACRSKGLPGEFFSPFFESVEKGVKAFDPSGRHPVVEELLGVFLRRTEDRHSALLFVPGSETSDLTGRIEGAAVMTSSSVDSAVSSDFIPGFRRSALICAVMLLILVAFVYRNPVDFVLVFLPAGCAALWGAGCAAATGFVIDAAVCIAFVLVLGLAVDYGVFAVYRREGDGGGDTARAMVLSAVTTMVGAGAMMVAEHPAVCKLGTVLFFGILLTALSALYLVPALTRLRSSVFMAVALLPMLSGCVTSPFDAAKLYPQQKPEETRIWNVTAEIFWYSVSMLVAVQIDDTSGSVHVVGMTPTGMTLFESAGCNGVESKRFISPVIPEAGAERLFGNIQEDFARVFFSAVGPETAEESEGLWPFCGWSVLREGRSGDGNAFGSAVYKNRSSHCSFIFKEVGGDG